MGRVENISYDRFPRQRNLGKVIYAGRRKDNPVTVVRWDAEKPNRRLYRTEDGRYFQQNELGKLILPKQNEIGGKVEVSFHMNLDKYLEGEIVRDDNRDPFIRLFKLNDERVLYARECYYSHVSDEQVPAQHDLSAVIDMMGVEKKLELKKSLPEKISYLMSIYSQLVPNDEGRTSDGEFNRKYSIYRKSEQSLMRVDGSEESVRAVCDILIEKFSSEDFAKSIASKMRRYGLGKQAKKLESLY